MSADVSTLGLRLDANGFVIPGQQVVNATESIGAAATKVEKKIQAFGTNAAFAVSSFAGSAAKDFTSVLRSASALAFAFGPTIGVITLSVSSIADAFQSARESSKSEMSKMLDDLTAFEREFGKKARRIRIAALEARIEQLQSQMNAPATAAATPMQAFGKMFRQGIGKLFGDANAPAEPEQADIQALNDRLAALRLVDAEAARAKGFEDWARDNANAMSDFNDELDRADRHADFVRSMEEKFTADDIARGNAAHAWRMAKAEKDVDQIMGGMQHIGFYAAGKVAQHGGPFGGMIGGIGANLMMGNPWGAAAAGITGFIDGLLGTSEAAKQAREAQKLLQRQYEDFTDSVKVQLGHISQTDADVNAIKRQFDALREAIFQGIVAGGPKGLNERYGAGMEKIDELNRLEQELIEKRKKEADEMERLLTAYRNAPTGFFVEKYLRQSGAVIEFERGARPGSRSMGGGGQMVFNLAAGSISVNAGNRNGQQLVQELVAELRTVAAATVGTGAPLSSALDMMP